MLTHDQIIEKYRSMSAPDISTKYNIHLKRIYRILEQNSIPRRNPGKQQSFLRLEKTPISFNRFDWKELPLSERDLVISSLMLYYGEGAKNGTTVDLANGDVNIILIFLKFLREICKINENRLKFYLYCFSNQDVNEVIDFWCKTLKVDKNQFTKPYIKESTGKHQNKLTSGVIHIRYSDIRLLNHILEQIKSLQESVLQVGR